MKILASMLKGLFEKWLRPQWIAGVRLKNSDIQEPAGSPYKLPKDYPAPRDILRQHFPRTADQCLFRGGWGYSIDDAVEVLEFDPEINPTQRFDGVSLEYAFVDKRIREELLFAKRRSNEFDRLRWCAIAQSLHMRNGVYFDHLLVQVTVDEEVYETEFWFNISSFY